MGTYILILMFVLVAIAVTFATYNLSIIRAMPPEERYKLLYFTDDQVSIGIGLVRRTYRQKIPQHGKLGRENEDLQHKW